MDTIVTLLHAFGIALDPLNLLWCTIGVILGTFIGVLPGVGPTAGIAILLPITSMLPPLAGLIMLAGIFYGAMYGGSTTSILVNMPGEVSSVVTCLDGYPLARSGRAGHALAVAAISSFFAGTLGLFGLTFFAPFLANFAFSLGMPEYFLLMVLALTIMVNLAGKSLIKAMLSGGLGLLVTTVGLDAITGSSRFAFGSTNLMGGMDFIAATIGLFAISEILINSEKNLGSIVAERVGGLYPSWKEIVRLVPCMVRSTLVGFLLGILPEFPQRLPRFLPMTLKRGCQSTPNDLGRASWKGWRPLKGRTTPVPMVVSFLDGLRNSTLARSCRATRGFHDVRTSTRGAHV